MQFIQGTIRHQSYFSTFEDQVSADNAVRLIDAFIDKLDPIAIGLQKSGFSKTVHKSKGLPLFGASIPKKLAFGARLQLSFCALAPLCHITLATLCKESI